MIRVMNVAGAVVIDGYPAPLPAGALQASLAGTVVTIANVLGGSALVSADFSVLADGNGDGFASVAAAMAYLASALAAPPARVVEAVADVDVVGGQPLAISRATGRMVLARADTYLDAFVVGLAMSAASAGFVAQAGRGAITLADWTATTGAPALLPGQPYFLASSGNLTTTPTTPGAVCIARIGTAATPMTLFALPTDPILL